MRICDRCGSKARDEILFKLDDMKIDLCDKCTQAVKEFASKPEVEEPRPKAKPGRKPKTKE